MSVESKETIKRIEKESPKGKILETIALINYIKGEKLAKEEVDIYHLEDINLDTLQVDKSTINNLTKIESLLEDPKIQSAVDEDALGNFMGNVFTCVRRMAKTQGEVPKELSNCINKKTEDFLEYLDKLAEDKKEIVWN